VKFKPIPFSSFEDTNSFPSVVLKIPTCMRKLNQSVMSKTRVWGWIGFPILRIVLFKMLTVTEFFLRAWYKKAVTYIK
jgi:hypothetical protein